jgi:MFS superfamily sulfate permease-like transporter
MKSEWKTVTVILVILAAFNLMALYKQNDMNAIVFFVLVAGVIYTLTKAVTTALVVGILASTMFRAVEVMREGMADKKSKKSKTAVASAVGPEAMDDMKSLMKQQEGLMQMAQNLQPLMQQASKLIEGLPDGVLERAMQKLKKK